MTLFYKKVALACLVSLTANQGMLAIQFPNVWNWMKENQKTSIGIIAGMTAVAVIAAIIVQQFKQKVDKFQSDLIVPRGEIGKMSERLGERLVELTNTPTLLNSIAGSSTHNIATLTKKGEGENPLACMIIDTRNGHLFIDHLAVDKSLWITSPIKKRLLDSVIGEARSDIYLGNALSASDIQLIKQQIMLVDKGIEPTYQTGVFRRENARTKLGFVQDQQIPTGITEEKRQKEMEDLFKYQKDVRATLASDQKTGTQRFNERVYELTKERLELRKNRAQAELEAIEKETAQARADYEKTISSPVAQEAA